jgi:hypothetical protein
VASVWIRERSTKSGTSYRVEYRPGGRDTGTRFAGAFRTKRLAVLRAAAVERELAELRLPDLTIAAAKPSAPTFAVAAQRWLESRIDVSDGTKLQNRTSVGRALPIIGGHRINELGRATSPRWSRSCTAKASPSVTYARSCRRSR